MFLQVKTGQTSSKTLRSGPAPTQFLKASNDGAVTVEITVEIGRELQRNIVEGMRSYLWHSRSSIVQERDVAVSG